jgi:hypothetical protein
MHFQTSQLYKNLAWLGEHDLEGILKKMPQITQDDFNALTGEVQTVVTDFTAFQADATPKLTAAVQFSQAAISEIETLQQQLAAEGSSVSLSSLTQQLQGLDANITGVKTALDNSPIPTLPPLPGATTATTAGAGAATT